MSKIIEGCLIFLLFATRLVELFISHHTFNQSDSKLKLTVTPSVVFSCAPGFLLPEVILSCHWLIVLFTFALIGCCNQIAFRFATPSHKD